MGSANQLRQCGSPCCCFFPAPGQQFSLDLQQWLCCLQLKLYALIYFVFLSPCYCFFCAVAVLSSVTGTAFKALLSSHFSLAYCLEVLIYKQVFNAFFTEGRLLPGEFFFHMELLLFWSYFCYFFLSPSKLCNSQR